MNLALLQDFIPETMQYLEDMESNLIRLESEPGNRRILNNIFQSVHMIKGSSEHMGVHRIAGLSHKMGSLLDVLRSAGMSADKALVDILMLSRNKIATIIGELERKGDEKAEVEILMDQRKPLFFDEKTDNPFDQPNREIGKQKTATAAENENSSKESNSDQKVSGEAVKETFSDLKFALFEATSKGVSETRKQLILYNINKLLKVCPGNGFGIVNQALGVMKKDVKAMIYTDDAGDILVSLNKLLNELNV